MEAWPFTSVTGPPLSVTPSRTNVTVPVTGVEPLTVGDTVTEKVFGTWPYVDGLGVAVIVIVVGALTFFPALSLGPIVEHFLMQEGRLFSTLFVSLPVWS